MANSNVGFHFDFGDPASTLVPAVYRRWKESRLNKRVDFGRKRRIKTQTRVRDWRNGRSFNGVPSRQGYTYPEKGIPEVTPPLFISPTRPRGRFICCSLVLSIVHLFLWPVLPVTFERTTMVEGRFLMERAIPYQIQRTIPAPRSNKDIPLFLTVKVRWPGRLTYSPVRPFNRTSSLTQKVARDPLPSVFQALKYRRRRTSIWLFWDPVCSCAQRPDREPCVGSAPLACACRSEGGITISFFSTRSWGEKKEGNEIAERRQLFTFMD